MKIAFIMDPLESLKIYKDSSVALMQEGAKAGHDLYYILQPDLYIAGQKARAKLKAVRDSEDTSFALDEYTDMALGDIDVIFMRKDPPVDKAFMQTTFILAQAARDGAKVLNAPAALQNYNEKIYATLFPEFTPKTMVACDKDTIIDFVQSLERAVLKPVDMMGGYGVFVSEAKDHNLDVIVEMLTNGGQDHIIVQQFLPQITEGDRRLIVINGQIADHALVRYPKQGSLRGNMAAGGSTGVEPVNVRDREIAEALGPRLVKDGVFLAGLDVIGGRLIEINHTSPTGLREIYKGAGENLAAKIIAEATKS